MTKDWFNPETGAFKDNIRLELGDLAELRESFQINGGWIDRPQFRGLGDTKTGHLLIGNRRKAVAIEGGFEWESRIDWIDFGDGEDADKDRLKLALASNLGGRPMTPADRKHIAEHLYGEKGWVIAKIAEALGVGKSTVGRDLEGFDAAPKPAKEADPEGFPTVGKPPEGEPEGSSAPKPSRPKGGRPKGSTKPEPVKPEPATQPEPETVTQPKPQASQAKAQGLLYFPRDALEKALLTHFPRDLYRREREAIETAIRSIAEGHAEMVDDRAYELGGERHRRSLEIMADGTRKHPFTRKEFNMLLKVVSRNATASPETIDAVTILVRDRDYLLAPQHDRPFVPGMASLDMVGVQANWARGRAEVEAERAAKRAEAKAKRDAAKAASEAAAKAEGEAI